MYEFVNKYHPDKVADRIAGAIVDAAYQLEKNPKIAVEVLIGHGFATVIVESSVNVSRGKIKEIVERISGIKKVKYIHVPQDVHLANNQAGDFRCGDNGIFKGAPITEEQIDLIALGNLIASYANSDGKYILDRDNKRLVICQSNCDSTYIRNVMPQRFKNKVDVIINPLGSWTGGTNVDSGATNRKLGSDMGDSVTGGGLHGKDLTKADVSINIYAFLKAQKEQQEVKISCAIGDRFVDGKPYGYIVAIAKDFIEKVGGFEEFASLGLINSYIKVNSKPKRA